MGGWERIVTGLAMVASSASACATAREPWDGPVPEHWGPTLLVESAAADHIAVRVNGLRVGTVTRGRNCLALPASSGSLVLDFTARGEGARAPEPIHLVPGGHWRLSIEASGRLERDVLTLTPVAIAC